jgi:hypothetical protein
VNVENALRAAAVVAAVALVGAPYWSVAAQAAIRAALLAVEAAKRHKAGLTRTAAAGLIVAAAWGKVPMPSFDVQPARRVQVETPSDAMRKVVSPIADALKAAPMSDRMLWAELWNKAALVAAGDAISTEVVFTDTRAMRLFTVLALDIGWRRIGVNKPGQFEGLREATEAAFASVIGTSEVPVTKELRAKYAELARAIAWAGLNAG